jgi:hypothetical protein
MSERNVAVVFVFSHYKPYVIIFANHKKLIYDIEERHYIIY